MREATVIDLFLTIRVFAVGGILLVLPRISRTGLLFGVYVTEAVGESESARRVLRGWDLGCAVIMVLALAAGWGLNVGGRPLAGTLTGTGVLLIGALVLYLGSHSRARGLVPASARRQGVIATAPVGSDSTKGVAYSKLSIGYSLTVSLAALAYVIASYYGDGSPGSGLQDALAADGMAGGEGVVELLFTPSMNLIWTPFLAVSALLTASAKRSVRGGSGGRSVEAQEAFRGAMANMLSTAAIGVSTMFALFSVELVRRVAEDGGSLWPWIVLVMASLLLFLFISTVVLMAKYGQGGARMEEGSAEAPLTGGLADNARWVLGVFYVDRDDPSILVEKRFGFGYTLNFGSRIAWLLLGVFTLPMTALMVLKKVFGG